MTASTTSSAPDGPAPGGLYLRPNLAATGTVPAHGTLESCPDVIGASAPVDDPQAAFGTPESWATAYDVAPAFAVPNYYYVRAGNTASGPVSGFASLYWAEAQLIAWPQLWTAHVLRDESGADGVAITVPEQGIGVAAQPLVLTDPPLPADADAYAMFVAQLSGAARPAPPVATTLLEMSELLTNRLDLGFRNTATLPAADPAWRRVLTVFVPDTVTEATALTFSLQGSGLVGATVGLSSSEVVLKPVAFTQEGQVVAIDATLEPGARFELEVQLWNTTGHALAAGYALNLAVDYPVPPTKLGEAIGRGVLDARRSRLLADATINPPQPVAPLGMATFIGV